MTGRITKKNKRGERGSIETEELSSSKRLNMADTESQLDDASSSNSAAAITDEHEPTRAELKEVLIDIQINVNNLLRDNIKIREEVVALRTTIQQQQEELTKIKPLVLTLQQELEDARRKTDEQEEEISQLYDLQDRLEQYTRKNSLEIHGIPENVYSSTEEAVLEVAKALDVEVRPDDIEISHHLKGEAGAKPIIVKFVSHKKKAELYKQRTKLRNTSLSDVFPEASAASIVSSKGIYINENLTSFRRELLKEANKKRKNNIISSAWTIDGKVFVKISPASRPIRIYDRDDLEDL